MIQSEAVILEQVFGFVGLVLLVVSWQFRAQRTILLLNVAAFLFFALGLYLLGAVVGAVMMISAAVMATAAALTRDRWVVALTLAGPVALGVSQITHPYDVLPVVAHVTGGIAFFSRDVMQMRRWAPVGTVLWAIYNIIAGAWGQFLADLLILSSMAIGAYRYRHFRGLGDEQD